MEYKSKEVEEKVEATRQAVYNLQKAIEEMKEKVSYRTMSCDEADEAIERIFAKYGFPSPLKQREE